MPRLTKSVSATNTANAAKIAADAQALADAAAATAQRAAAEAVAKAAAEKAAHEADEAAKGKAMPSGGALRARVDAIADALEAHDEFNQQLEEVDEAIKTKARGPCAYVIMLEAFLSSDQLDSLPIPGSTQKSHPQNPDQYQDEIGGQKVRSSYYRDLVRRMPIGRKSQLVIEACKQFTGNDPACPDQYKALTAKQIKDLKDDAEKTISNAATSIRKAVELRNQMALIAEVLPTVQCEIMFEKDGDGDEVLRPGSNCILLADTLNAAEGEYVNADKVLGFRVNYAKTQVKPGVVSEYKALKFSGGKPGATGTGGTGATATSGMTPRVTTMAKAMEYMQELGAFFANANNHKLIINAFSKEDSDAFVTTFGDLLGDMDAQFTGPTEERYKRIKIAQQQARNDRDAAKVKEGATK